MKIGIMGGTFDPIHNGHLQILRQAYSQLCLDEVIIIPTARPPHKEKALIQACAEDRYKMVQLAIEDLPYASVSSFEMDQQKIHYTIDTLEYFAKNKKAEYFLIIGGDSWASFKTWKDHDRIMELAKIVVADRDASEDQGATHSRKVELQMDKINLSSSEIREMIVKGKDVSSKLPLAVIKYIQERALYGGGYFSCQ